MFLSITGYVITTLSLSPNASTVTCQLQVRLTVNGLMSLSMSLMPNEHHLPSWNSNLFGRFVFSVLTVIVFNIVLCAMYFQDRRKDRAFIKSIDAKRTSAALSEIWIRLTDIVLRNNSHCRQCFLNIVPFSMREIMTLFCCLIVAICTCSH